MREDRLSGKEEILRMTAPLPVLSSGLRSRVLEAAGEACDRRKRGRRAIASALLAFGLVGSFTWFRPSFKGRARSVACDSARPNDGRDEPSGSAEGGPTSSGGYSRSELLMSAMGDDWKMVEAEFRSREEFTRRFQIQSQM